MNPLEALADAIMTNEGWHGSLTGGSRAWRNRNPGNLRPWNPAQPCDEGGYRIFPSLALGWQALLDDLQAKFNGSHDLGPAATMLALLNIYAPAGDTNNPTSYCTFVCTWTSAILGRTITPSTTLAEYLGTTVPQGAIQ